MSRTPGSIGKDKRLAIRKLKEIYGNDFDPLMMACESAMRIHVDMTELYLADLDEVDPDGVDLLKPSEKLQFRKARTDLAKDSVSAWIACAQFTTPKLKPVEQVIDDDGTVRQLGDTEVVARVMVLLDKARERRAITIDGQVNGGVGASDGSSE